MAFGECMRNIGGCMYRVSIGTTPHMMPCVHRSTLSETLGLGSSVSSVPLRQISHSSP